MHFVFRKILAPVLAGIFLLTFAVPASAQPLENTSPLTLTSPSYLLIEADTGTVIFEKNADEQRQTASLIKLMSLLLFMEHLDQGAVTLNDTICVSSHAAATPGSTALLDAGASYRLEDLLRASIVASGNDSTVALAEYMAGTEEAFVQKMNARAAELGLNNTHYVNCTGLTAQGQYTCARDIGIVACELSRHTDFFSYSSLWLSSLTHPSGRVTDLTNTNRLVRFYDGCDGMKTGSSNEAKYCISATASKNGMRLIAVALGTKNSQTRFDEARSMLEYGFSNYRRVEIISSGELTGYSVPVTRGAREEAPVAAGKGLSMLLKSGQESQLSIEMQLPQNIEAPMPAGEIIGSIQVLLGGTRIAELPAVLAEDVRLPGFLEGFLRILENWR